ncbi:MAG: hypothetical protein V8T16_11320 [Parabacteroides merdae]
MDRRKFIQTGVAGVAGLSLVRTGLANIRMAVPSDISVDRVKLGKTGLKVSRISYGNRDERLELPVQSDPARTG